MTTSLLLALTAVAAVAAMLARRAANHSSASERRYRALASQWPDLAIGLIDQDLRFVLFEGEALGDYWASSEVIGHTLDEVIAPDRVSKLRQAVEAALAGEPGRVDWVGLRSGRNFRVDVVPFREHGAKVDHAMLAVRDITDEIALQRTIEDQRGFFSAVLSQLGDRISVCDADGVLISFGTPPSSDTGDLHPLEWAEHFGMRHPDGQPFGPHEAPLLRALRGDEVRDVELHVDTPDGTVSLLAGGGPVTTPEGRRLGAVVVTADLTAFRDAEGRLRRSEERHRRVVESMVDCVFETDELGRWTHLSENWTAATGHLVEDSLGRSSIEFVHPDDHGRFAQAFAPLLAGEQLDGRVGHRFLTTAGAERWAEVQVRAISGWDGLPTGFAGVMRDVTDEHRARQHANAEGALMRLLSAATNLDDVGEGLIEALARELGWDGAELWRMSEDELLRRSSTWTAPGMRLDRFLEAGADVGYEVGDGFPGQSWMSRVPLWRSSVAGEPDGIRTAAALPVRYEGMPVAVVVLVSRTAREPEPGLVRLLEVIGGHVTQFVRRREAERRVAEQAEDLKKLSAVAHELAAQSDLYGARMTLTRAVRDVTAASSVVLWEPTATGEELEVSAATGAALQGMTFPLAERSVIGNAFHTGDLEFISDVDVDQRIAPRLRGLTNARSAAWVPVIQDGRSLGVLLVSWETQRAELTERDNELLRLLAAEAAITIHRTDLLARLESTARTDPLTGLPNRRVWDEDLERELARARRHGGELCLAMVDLDRFKAFNDRYGHQAGDRLLAAAATAWRPALRTTDTIARYGGEEFAVLLPHSDEEGALVVVERLLEVVPLGQTASAGVASWDGSETAAELLARADAALYAAKNAGRARALLASAASTL